MDKDYLVNIIWNYHHMNQTLEKCDCIFALGSYDTDVAQRGVELFN